MYGLLSACKCLAMCVKSTDRLAACDKNLLCGPKQTERKVSSTRRSFFCWHVFLPRPPKVRQMNRTYMVRYLSASAFF